MSCLNIEYNHSDLLEYFDEATTDDRCCYLRASVTSQDGIYLAFTVDSGQDGSYEAVFSLMLSNQTLFTGNIDNLESIVTDKKNESDVRFLFYQYNEKLPTVIVTIKPILSLHFNGDKQGNISQFPYRDMSKYSNTSD